MSSSSAAVVAVVADESKEKIAIERQREAKAPKGVAQEQKPSVQYCRRQLLQDRIAIAVGPAAVAQEGVCAVGVGCAGPGVELGYVVDAGRDAVVQTTVVVVVGPVVVVAAAVDVAAKMMAEVAVTVAVVARQGRTKIVSLAAAVVVAVAVAGEVEATVVVVVVVVETRED